MTDTRQTARSGQPCKVVAGNGAGPSASLQRQARADRLRLEIAHCREVGASKAAADLESKLRALERER